MMDRIGCEWPRGRWEPLASIVAGSLRKRRFGRTQKARRIYRRLANVIQFALASAEAFPLKQGASPAKADVENAPAASKANIVLVMCIRQHGFTDVQSRWRRKPALQSVKRDRTKTRAS